MELKGIIFDLDGVIVDTVPAHFAAWKRMFEEEGYAFDLQVYHDKVDGRRRVDGAAAVMNGADDQRIAAASNRKETYFLELINRGEFRVFDSTVAFIDACHKAGIALATASSSRNVKYILEKAGIADQFGAIVGGDDVEIGKPDPSIFRLAAKRLGLAPTNCIVIEDAISGVQAAKAGGFFCVGIDRTNRPSRVAGADMVIRDLSDLDVKLICEVFTGGPSED